MEYPLWSLIPFVTMLACIAVLPLIPATSHWWERNSSQLTVALVLAIPTTAWMCWKAGSAPLIDTGIEYFQFICLLFSLYVVSGASTSRVISEQLLVTTHFSSLSAAF